MQNIRKILTNRIAPITLVLCIVLFATNTLLAWTGPSQSAPNGNISAPVNVGSTDQVKNAGLSLNALAVFGNAILSGVSRYLNFGTTAGSGGYGIRDNAGVMEVKNNGGSWTSIGTASGQTPWLVSGTNVYYNGGNVGIGTASPTHLFHVNGAALFMGQTTSNAGFTSLNPNNGSAAVSLNWLNDIARIRVSGTGVGAGNGIDIQGPGDSSIFRVTGAGNVGIGTVSPGAKLEVRGGRVKFYSEDYNSTGSPYTGTLTVYGSGFIGGGGTFGAVINNGLIVDGGIDLLSKGLTVEGGGFSVLAGPTDLYTRTTLYGNTYLWQLASAAGSHYLCINNNNWLVSKSGSCGSSDARLKEHIQPLQAGLAEIIKLNPVTFEWKDKDRGEGTKIGLIAQEVQEVFPEVITGTGTGINGDWYGVDYNALVAPMIKAIQELKAENDRQNIENETLRAELEGVREEIKRLKQRY